jgi:EAL domain-containing protein (putative c-di-GMP-specific phosphodiesterase class I)
MPGPSCVCCVSQALDLPPFVSINLSAAELGDPLIVETIRLALEKKGMLPQELKIELTETVVIEDRAHSR